ncbi:hypothetical protein JCM10908_002515 [Rhodotorula pacifica]|uniref:uncharacterized protein n=1 Tax=Rhodotorula pacifica TaxID=1495444 RepID=UPI00317D7B64
MATRVERIKADLRAKRRLSGWALPKPESAFTPDTHWSNYDMEPVPLAHQTWTGWTFAAYWFSDLVNAGSWTQISSFVGMGMTWWEGVLATFLGGFLIAIVIVFNGIVGARLHTPFAISGRAAFGYWLVRFCVVSRMVIAWFWFSINTYQGGVAFRICLTAIWPSFAHFKNRLSPSAGLTSSDMLCFFLFWLFQFPLILIHPRRLRPIFLMKAVTLPVVAIGMMGWTIHKAGDRASEVMRAPSTLSGLNGFFLFMTAVTSAQGIWSTMAINIGDFSRYSKKESSAVVQLIAVPGLFTITALFGAIAANMTTVIPRYGGVATFQPFDVMEKGGWLESHGGRAAAFFCSAAWALGSMTTNITANSVSSANDLASLFPRWVNILRGQVFCAVIGCWAFCPWKVLASASSFVSFMGAYSIVLSPIAAILCADFFLVKGGKYSVPDLYDFTGRYRYFHGFNLAALAALLVSIPPNLPGMIHALNSDIDIGNAKYIFCVANIFGMVVAVGTHVGISKLFPDRTSLISEAILAQDVLDGLVPGYEHLATARRDALPVVSASASGSELASAGSEEDEKKETA